MDENHRNYHINSTQINLECVELIELYIVYNCYYGKRILIIPRIDTDRSALPIYLPTLT
jgi:hypothetical protein